MKAIATTGATFTGESGILTLLPPTIAGADAFVIAGQPVLTAASVITYPPAGLQSGAFTSVSPAAFQFNGSMFVKASGSGVVRQGDSSRPVVVTFANPGGQTKVVTVTIKVSNAGQMNVVAE